jgi:Ca2+-binding EF-hand superfamily protein
MRQVRCLVGVATLVVAVGGGGVASAGGDVPDVPLRGPIPFEAFDLDGSGAISRQEFDQTHTRRDQAREQAGLPSTRRRHAFGDVDADGNGQITSEELHAVHGARGDGRGRGPGSGRGLGMGRGDGPPAFSEFDLNGDGRIDEPEFAEARAARVTERAKEGRRLRGMATAPPFAELDTDGDGSLTPDEFGAGARRHRQGGGHGAPDQVEP